MRWTKGKHAFIVATHIDRSHIHNHIIYNSTSLDCTRKFKNFFLSGLAVQRLSDMVCIEHGLSIIEPKPYRERVKRTIYPKKRTKRDELCAAIDQILKKKEPFQLFLQIIKMNFNFQAFTKLIGISSIIFFYELSYGFDNMCCRSHLLHLQTEHRKIQIRNRQISLCASFLCFLYFFGVNFSLAFFLESI